MRRIGNDPMRRDFCPTCFVEGGCICVVHQGRFEEIKHLQDESDDCEICWGELHAAYGNLAGIRNRGVSDGDDYVSRDEVDARTRQAG